MLFVERPDRFEIGGQQLRDFALRPRLQQSGDAVAPFRRTPSRLAVEIVAPRARMGVDEAERGFLAGEIGEQTRQERVLENVGEIAGVEDVAIVHPVFIAVGRDSRLLSMDLRDR